MADGSAGSSPSAAADSAAGNCRRVGGHGAVGAGAAGAPAAQSGLAAHEAGRCTCPSPGRELSVRSGLCSPTWPRPTQPAQRPQRPSGLGETRGARGGEGGGVSAPALRVGLPPVGARPGRALSAAPRGRGSRTSDWRHNTCISRLGQVHGASVVAGCTDAPGTALPGGAVTAGGQHLQWPRPTGAPAGPIQGQNCAQKKRAPLECPGRLAARRLPRGQKAPISLAAGRLKGFYRPHRHCRSRVPAG